MVYTCTIKTSWKMWDLFYFMTACGTSVFEDDSNVLFQSYRSTHISIYTVGLSVGNAHMIPSTIWVALRKRKWSQRKPLIEHPLALSTLFPDKPFFSLHCSYLIVFLRCCIVFPWWSAFTVGSTSRPVLAGWPWYETLICHCFKSSHCLKTAKCGLSHFLLGVCK